MRTVCWAALPCLGILIYLLLALNLTQGFLPFLEHKNLNRLLSFQILGLSFSTLYLFLGLYFRPEARVYLAWGETKREVRGLAYLGIRDGQTWARAIGETSIAISLATGLFMYFSFEVLDFSGFAGFLPFILFLSAANAWNEELLVRWGCMAYLGDRVSPRFLAVVSGIIFGLPHYWGYPSGWLGVAMAGFLGWFLAKASLETRGLGLAWALHFVQDLIIFSFIFLGPPPAP